ncbi:hypothetical protein [Aquimarina sediminis]|uniref:hypothetical protein n=1 Tax=Aquimarina sediminis TaxID=2070536 RepID=UPI000FFF57C9|nr:hypothetical protein [Aquimarina sediminis]
MINDLYLKYEYHNYITGKLSDFAGLFAFPYFFSCFFPKKIKAIYILSGVLFVFWKSELSQPFIHLAHSYGIGMNRTIDSSDFIALLILPISYIYWNWDSKLFEPTKILKPMVIGISCFAFIATSLPEHYEQLSMKSEFSINVNSNFESVRTQLHLYKNRVLEEGNYSINLPKKNARILTSIKVDSIDEKTTRIILDSILSFAIEENGFIFSSGIDDDIEYIKSLSIANIEQLFSKQIQSEFKEK